MNEKSLRTLEFTKIRDRLAALALTEPGRDRCLALVPHASLSAAAHAQDETEEALLVLLRRGDSPIIPFTDVGHTVGLAEKGASLSPRALLDIAASLRAAGAAQRALEDGDRERTPSLSALASALMPLRPLERTISDAIISEEEIADGASPALADIRRRMRLTGDRIREKLQQIAHGQQSAKYLQDSLVTVRNGRYVLPVRQEYRAQVPGLVHDQSSSGATLFIEPTAVVELGNELRQWELKESEEIRRILAELSARAADHAADIRTNVDILVEMDFRFAKAALAREMRCVRPKLNDKGWLRFVRVRHPLIPPESVVPCDLWLGKDFTCLVITGPNTGGKTVTLKTVGLISLMAAAGLQVPGQEGTEAAVFQSVFADIGDEQSIEQSLSTFSSHMKNIVGILEDADKGDLVLFDELGAGTDPTEGAALAQAILQRMLKIGVRTVATTHYSELKAFALSTPGAANASVEFDVATLSPTYRLLIGVPGKSNAFEISRRLGLSSRLIEDAQAMLSRETLMFEDVLAKAEQQRQAAERERESAEAAREESDRLREEAARLHREMEELRRGAREKARDEARRIIEKAKRESAEVLEELRGLKNADPSQINPLRQRLRTLNAGSEEGVPLRLDDDSLDPAEVREGMRVLLAVNNAEATVLSAPDAKGEVQVQAGIIKLKVPADQLKRATQPGTKAKSVVRAHSRASESPVKMEVDVRGMMLDEALMAVENYLDNAVMAGLHEVYVIHGKGTGALRAGLRDALKGNRHISAMRPGKYGEGEAGVTVVTLR
ncbi:MAG TPA: endonuclease MutS2 [Candidatus Limnocylindria bacterium]|nr:endonuclease MutS2 [Candidatus Limnocylindria bacterium]